MYMYILVATTTTHWTFYSDQYTYTCNSFQLPITNFHFAKENQMISKQMNKHLREALALEIKHAIDIVLLFVRAQLYKNFY